MSLEISSDVLAVTGLDWNTTTPAEWKKQRKELRSEGLLTTFFQVTDPQSRDSVINYGAIPRDSGQLEGNQAKVSLAGLLALSIKDGHIVVIERLPGESEDEAERYWFCAINNGQVITGTDVVGEFSEIQPLIQDHRDLFGGDGIRIIGNAADTEDVGASTDSVVHYLDESLVPQATILRKRSASGYAWILIIGITTIMVAVGSVLLFIGKEEPKRPQMSPEEILAQQQQIARSQLAEKEAELLGATELRTHLEYLLHGPVGALPAKAGGWQLTSTACDSSACISEFTNTDLTPPAVLEQAGGKACATIIVGALGESASCVSIVQAHPVSEHPRLPNWKLTLSDRRGLLDSFMSMARAFPGDVAYRTGEPQPVAFPGREALSPDELFGIGEFTLQIRSDISELVVKKIYDQKPLILDTVSFNWSENVTEIEGRFISVGESE